MALLSSLFQRWRGTAATGDPRLLPEAQLSGPMPWVIAIMIALTVVAAASGLALRNAAQTASALHQAARVTGGARYVAFEGELPKLALHSAIAAPYAHVTAPLRRLADRYVLDLLIELAQGRRPAPAEIAELHRLPKVMAEAEQAARRLESMIVDYAEALLMKDRAGEIFQAVIIALRAEGLVVQITDPPIRTLVPAAALSISEQKLQPVLSPDGATLSIGSEQFTLRQTIRLRLESASPATRSLQFSLVH